MKRFLIEIAVFASIHACVLAGLVQANQRWSNDYLAASIDKHRRLDASPSPRMIFVGGSSTAFGIDSSLVAEQTNYHPVNMALTMQLGLEFMLCEIEGKPRPGDIVVIAPEYDMYSRRPARAALTNMLVLRPSTAWCLPPGEQKLAGDRGLALMGQLFSGLRTSWLEAGAARGEGAITLYRRRGFNPWGDHVGHHVAEPPGPAPAEPERAGPARDGDAGGLALPRDLTRGEADTPEGDGAGVTVLPEVLDSLNRFHARCRADGVQVVLTFPPYPERVLAADRARINRIIDALAGGCTIPLAGTPEAAAFPQHAFFDQGSHHLSKAGATERTRRLLHHLHDHPSVGAAASTPLFKDAAPGLPAAAPPP